MLHFARCCGYRKGLSCSGHPSRRQMRASRVTGTHCSVKPPRLNGRRMLCSYHGCVMRVLSNNTLSGSLATWSCFFYVPEAFPLPTRTCVAAGLGRYYRAHPIYRRKKRIPLRLCLYERLMMFKKTHVYLTEIILRQRPRVYRRHNGLQ